MKKTKTSKIALGGICLALTLIFLYAASILPGVELTMLALASLFTAVMILEMGIGGGLLLFTAASILGFMLVPNKLALIPYVFLFGYYGVLKYFMEKPKNGIAQITSKAAFFAAALSIGLLGFKELLLGAVKLPEYPIAVLIIGGVLLLLLYDFLFTQLINFYVRRVQRKGMDDFKLS